MKVITYIHKGEVKTITLDELRAMKVDLSNAWEKVCHNCGKCCFDKKLDNGNLVINYDKPCGYLKFMGRKSQCEVYSNRFEKNQICYTISEALRKRCLPADCPYVKDIPGYKSPIDNGGWYKKARIKLSRYDDDSANAGTPTGGTMNLPAQPPVREDLAKPKDWKRRRREAIRRKQSKPEGMIDPREKTNYNIKPSGHALGG